MPKPTDVGDSAEVQSTEKAIEKGEVTWTLVYLLGYWQRLDPSEHPEKRTLAEREYHSMVDAFKLKEKVEEVAVIPPAGGAYVKKDGELRVSIDGSIDIDLLDASWLIFKIDSLAAAAKDWWRGEAQPSESEEDNKEASARQRVRGKLRVVSEPEHPAAERKPHSMRAYGLATSVLTAIAQEKARRASSGFQTASESNDSFRATLAGLSSELAVAQRQFRQAAQRAAQSRYWRGMLGGAVVLALLCCIIGIAFWLGDVDAAYGVALPAGGVGAIVSVLQRMSSGKLILDFEAGRDLLEVFGAVRPFIGGVFGIAVMALLLGGLASVIRVPAGQELAFFAGVGFLAGFNERWAQDMLKGSSKQMGPNFDEKRTDPQTS